ncbi:structural studies On the mobility in the active site of the Thermoascus Aurantiacus xylanase I [Lineolata rhizophorae]|uniref:Beta-xylanase n=1 Tax=Lineolata rhizophorae TaxID=578093 RepID=A0A6A6NS82_9PEZI|nr:structural studies On the mobility in the active site of the Thermoascus Aurantiacus xylanase I [Lineolata rhizophorae]
MRSSLLSLGLSATAVYGQAQNSIHDVFMEGWGKYFGTCTDQGLLQGRSAEVIQQNFGQVTPENSMKWDSTEPSRGNFNFGQADFLVNWATENNKIIRGHTTVWHSQLPGWVSNIYDSNTLTQVIENHVTTLIGRWKGQIYAWDVVNEILAEDGSLRQSIFSQVFQDGFVPIAFNAAREADPDCKLYINDYNLDQASYGKTQGMVRWVGQWRDAGVPIDGIGSQSHLTAGLASSTPGAMQALCAAADECAITELDIVNASPDDYTTATNACRDIENCVGVTVWGVSDPNSWRSQNNPLLFDGNFNPKPAYDAIYQDLVNNMPEPEPTTTSTPTPTPTPTPDEPSSTTSEAPPACTPAEPEDEPEDEDDDDEDDEECTC